MQGRLIWDVHEHGNTKEMGHGSFMLTSRKGSLGFGINMGRKYWCGVYLEPIM